MNFQSVKPVRFLLAFIAFYFVAVPSFRLPQELERQALNIAWYQGLKEGTPNTQVFEDFIKDAQENLEKIVKDKLLIRDEVGLEKTIPKCNPQVKPPIISIRKNQKEAFFDCIRVADFDTESKTDYKKRSEQSKQDIVVRQFDQIVRGQGAELVSKKGEDVSLEYSRIFINNLTGDSNFLDRLPGFRIDTVYLFDEKNGVIALYPGTKEGVYNNGRRIDYRERPWYKSGISQYETVYLEDFSGDTSGLTGTFIDITDTFTPNAIRTLWYRFKDTNGNQYVLAFDMFFDETEPIFFSNSFLSFFWLSTLSEWIILVLIALPSSLILSLLYEELVKRLRNTDSFNNLSGIRFTLIKEYYATLNDENISFNDTNVTISLSSVQTSAGVTLSLQGTGMEGKIERTAQQNRQEEKAYSYSFDHEYSLKVGPVRPTHKAVQIWQAEREPHLGKSQIVGHVVADWKTNNTVSSSGELSIKSIFWNKKEEVYFPSFQRQLRDHLLTGETGELTLVPDTQYQKRQSIPALLSDIDPDKLETVPELKQVIDNSFDLDQGRFFVSQLETVETLYALGNVKAIYSIPFVRKIITKGKHDFFRTTAMDTDREERFVLEHEAHHFKNRVYNHLNQSIQDDWKNESPFQIMVHQRSATENVILEQEGFSLIYINNVLRFVLYSLSDDTYSGIGWVSWRKVDLEFFKTLYEYQRSKGNFVKTVKSYIEA
ncbi:MAG: hypothetical protein F6K23_00515 [Okeania sp. SIO2C9]|uniref:hypothetical protein n=1 Tax=Okeania sp. SIO2C9 TaxID=2607791 RepID=UPI0013BF2E79|nr:hypothetical protein [Okeania sp. SIO2C9]NEQ71695.1 hypothetical protein [Okeania sp. SIO2C9]